MPVRFGSGTIHDKRLTVMEIAIAIWAIGAFALTAIISSVKSIISEDYGGLVLFTIAVWPAVLVAIIISLPIWAGLLLGLGINKISTNKHTTVGE